MLDFKAQHFHEDQKARSMKRKSKNPNDHKIVTPRTAGREHDARAFTSYDTTKKETASPQKVSESREGADEQIRLKKEREKKT